MSDKIKIMIATHKEYRMPTDDMYLPVFVGKEINKNQLNYIGDNTGDNISTKNKNFNELTAMYWAWKNLDADVIGLAHYRRHFKGSNNGKNKFENIITGPEVEVLMRDYDILLPKKRKYFIETTYSQYIHAHPKKDIDNTRSIMIQIHPEYVESFDESMEQKSSHRFNMFIMKRPKFNDYCEWLFSILFELEKRTDISQYDTYQARIYGFISERLFDIWLAKQNLKSKELPVMFMEKQDWIVKGSKFLKRKFFNEEIK